jgi:hypothetical protein
LRCCGPRRRSPEKFNLKQSAAPPASANPRASTNGFVVGEILRCSVDAHFTKPRTENPFALLVIILELGATTAAGIEAPLGWLASLITARVDGEDELNEPACPSACILPTNPDPFSFVPSRTSPWVLGRMVAANASCREITEQSCSAKSPRCSHHASPSVCWPMGAKGARLLCSY